MMALGANWRHWEQWQFTKALPDYAPVRYRTEHTSALLEWRPKRKGLAITARFREGRFYDSETFESFIDGGWWYPYG